MGVGRNWLLKAPFLFLLLSITACSDGKPQVDFLKLLTNGMEPTGVTLKINGSSIAWSQNPTPVVEVSGFSNASKVEIFNSASCDASAKVGEASPASSDTLIPLTSTTLTTEGTYDYYAKITSIQGLIGSCSSQKATYTYDVTAPATPSGISLVTSTHNSATPTFQVNGMEVGATAFVYKDAACAVSMGSIVAISSSVSVTSTSITEGSYNYYARAVDPAGNSSACTTVFAAYIYDITPPAEPSSIALSTGVTTPSSNTTPSIDVGGLVINDSVKVYSDSLCLTEVISSVSTATTMTLATTLTADGTYEFHAKAVDSYGNASACSVASVAYVLDTTAPAAPTNLTLSSPASSPSNSPSLQILISPVSNGDTIKLFSDSSCSSYLTSGVASGSSITLTPPTLLTPATYQYYASAVDTAGNTSSCSVASLTYVYDNVSPTVTSVSSTNANKTYGPGAEISIQVTLDENVTVSTSGGTPTLTLNTTPSRTASYNSGSGSNVLSFTYVVQPGDSATDLNYTSSSSLLLNSGAIRDAAGNDLNAVLPATTASQSLGVAKDITIVEAPPVVKMTGYPTLPVSETAGSSTVQLSLSYDTFYPITVHVATYGNAIYGVDYSLSSDTVVFAAGSTSASFTVNIFNNASTDLPRKIKLSVDSTSGDHGASIYKISQKDIYLLDDETATAAPNKLAQGGTGAHSCLVKSDGDIKCWGNNNSGQLGDNSLADRLTPTLVNGSSASFAQSAVGGSHTCGIKNDGTLWCWGYGAKGALGNGSIATKLVPYQVGTLTTYTYVAAGTNHTCAVKSDGTLWCFGDNAKGQLGDGSANSQQNSPVQADSGTSYSLVAASENHTCGITSGGVLRCWGNNTYGQLGNGSASSSNITPTTINSGSTYTKISTGAYHTCGVVSGGILRCWGDNFYGQIGDGTTISRLSPVNVISSGVVDVVAGTSHTCALLSNYEVKCWGDNSLGQLGLSSVSSSSTPVSVFTSDIYSTQTISLSAGANHSCAVFSLSGEVRCWGYNSVGQLGTGTDHRVRIPALVEGNLTGIASGLNHTCGISSSGAVRCWGTNTYGQVGDGTTASRSSPVQVIVSGATKVAVGDYFSCAVLTGGKLQCWGYNGSYRLGDGTTTTMRLRPTTVIASGVTDVSLGVDHGCALLSSGAVQCWGNNTAGKVGNGSSSPQSTPVQVIGSGATQISVGDTHTCALLSSALYCWGDNSYGQFGNSSFTGSTTPMNTSLSMNFISVGNSYTCGIQSGDLYCWGLNNYAQLGDGSTTNKSSPTQIDIGISYAQVSAKYTHTCAITSGNALKCWGQNHKYQIADSSSNFSTPTTIASSSILQNSVSYFHTCFLNSSNELKCMGTNSSGQLGLGDLSILRLPLHVFGL